MTKIVDTLPEDIFKLFDDDLHLVQQSNIEQFAKEIAFSVQDALSGKKDKEWGLWASSIGQPCLRKTFYQANGYPAEALQPNVKLKFLFGHIIESLLLLLAREAGHNVERTQEKVENDDGVSGRIDAVIDGTVVDVKSAASRSFEKFSKGTLEDDDPFGYLYQLAFYYSVLGGPQPAFLAMDKQFAHLAVYKPTELPTDVDIAVRAADIKRTVAADNAPERDSSFDPVPDGKSGNMKLCTTCSYCAYKKECFPEVRGFAYANGPRFLTEVALLPKVPEFEIDVRG